MNVGKWGMLGLAAAVALLGSTARAADDQPSQALLAQMGLGGMTAMSDTDALAVRGHGYQTKRSSSSVRVYGHSYAAIKTKNGVAGSVNGYSANGKHFAAGANGSVAGVIHVSSGGSNHSPRSTSGNYGNMGGNGGGRPTVKATVVFAGGFSVGVAH